MIAGRGGGGDPGTVQRGELDGVGADAARAAVHQDVLPGLQPGVLVQGLPGGERAERNSGGREVIDGGRLGRKLGRGGGHVFGGGAGPVEADQAIDLTARGPALHSRPAAATTPDRSWQGMAGQLSGQVSSPAVTAVACTSTSSSPGPGSGTGMVS